MHGRLRGRHNLIDVAEQATALEVANRIANAVGFGRVSITRQSENQLVGGQVLRVQLEHHFQDGLLDLDWPVGR